MRMQFLISQESQEISYREMIQRHSDAAASSPPNLILPSKTERPFGADLHACHILVQEFRIPGRLMAISEIQIVLVSSE